jgi:hypothetical protein
VLAFAAAGFVANPGLAQEPPQPVVLVPGFDVLPFAGYWAGGPGFLSPKFGVIGAPGSLHPPFMFVSELNGNDVMAVMPDGTVMPYSIPPFASGAAGVDIDGVVANLAGNTMGAYGGPSMMYVAEVMNAGGIDQVFPGGACVPYLVPPIGQPGLAGLGFDRTPGFQYGGFLYVTDWGADGSDGVFMIPPGGAPPLMFAPTPGLDPRYMTFDSTGGATGYGPGNLWLTSYGGPIFSVLPNGAMGPILTMLQFGTEGLAFGLGDPYFGSKLYVGNLVLGTIDIVAPDGAVMPFAAGFPGAAYLMFVLDGPFAMNGHPTLYVLDGIDSVWAIMPQLPPCPSDLNGSGFVDGADLGILLGDWGPCGGCPSDLTLDGLVDGADLGILLGDWGPCVPN